MLIFLFDFFSYKSRTKTEHGCRSLGDGLAGKHPRHCDVDQYHGRHEGILLCVPFENISLLRMHDGA